MGNAHLSFLQLSNLVCTSFFKEASYLRCGRDANEEPVMW